jgi:hypothetical protein
MKRRIQMNWEDEAAQICVMRVCQDGGQDNDGEHSPESIGAAAVRKFMVFGNS